MKGKFTDLQLTMVQILEDKRIFMNDESNESIFLGCDFVSITRLSGIAQDRTLKTVSVRIDEMVQQIVIEDNVRHMGFDSNDGVYHCWKYTQDVVENYQVINNQMYYSETKKAFSEDSLDGGESKLIDSNQSTAVYELPEGYKITDGISVFEHRKDSIHNKQIEDEEGVSVLGGTYNHFTQREELIGMLDLNKVQTFNPFVDQWDR